MTLRPDTVVNAIKDYYELNPGCGGRSVHRYATKVTRHMSIARNKLAELFNTPSVDEVIFTKNATHSLNQVAKGLQWEKRRCHIDYGQRAQFQSRALAPTRTRTRCRSSNCCQSC